MEGNGSFSSKLELSIGYKFWDVPKVFWRIASYCDNRTLCKMACTCIKSSELAVHDNVWKEDFRRRCNIDPDYPGKVVVPLGSPRRRREEAAQMEYLKAIAGAEQEAQNKARATGDASEIAKVASSIENGSFRRALGPPPTEPPHSYYQFFRQYILNPKIIEGHWTFTADQESENEAYQVQEVTLAITRAKLGYPAGRHVARGRMVVKAKTQTNVYAGVIRYWGSTRSFLLTTVGSNCTVKGPTYMLLLQSTTKQWANQSRQQFLDHLGGPRLLIIPLTMSTVSGAAPDYGVMAVGRSLRHSK